MTKPSMLGGLLVAEGATTADELDAALDEQRETRERIGSILVRRGVSAEALARGLASQLRLSFAPAPLAPRSEAVRLLPRDEALRLRALPLAVSGRVLEVGLADPLDAAAIDAIQFRTGRRVEPVVVTPAALERGLATAYGEEEVRQVLERLERGRRGGGRVGEVSPGYRTGSSGPAASRGGSATNDSGEGGGENGGDPAGDGPGGGESPEPEAGDADVLRRASAAAPIVALVDLVLDRALGRRASDVHVEPGRDRLRVRARVDGVLQQILEAPAPVAPAVVSRLKIMAGLDIAVKRRPQDGRSSVRVAGRRVGVRVSTLPSQDGEKVVLRLLDPGGTLRSLDAVGMDPGLRAGLESIVIREHGLLLVTGPTGSGKTTTLYALLEGRDRVGRNIITLEDPVEYRLPGLTQVQVQARAGLTFATALRAVLRQDPDVIMVGEMRDLETVETGLAAALTGHLVLSTLHTNDAAGAVTRLAEMGAARYLIAGGLAGVLAQRLVRRLCDHCRTIAPVAGDDLYDLGLPTPPHLARPVGCDRCGGTGYRGRVGVFELLRVDATVRELILAGAPVDRIREAAVAGGMVSLASDAWAKVEQGLTSLEEVKPLLVLLADEARACRACAGRIARGQPYCPHCGGEVVERCACGTEARPHWRFCGACGEPMERRRRPRAE